MRQNYTKYWRSLVIVLAPILYLPIPLFINDAAARCGYVILIMATYWTTEAVHMAITALIPIFAFPLLGILSTRDVCFVYMKDTNMLFFGGLAIAVAVEHCGLHERIALFILLKVGCTPGRLLFGFMLAQMFLSMWISNTAATAMMVPIIDALLQKIEHVNKKPKFDSDAHCSPALDTLELVLHNGAAVANNSHKMGVKEQNKSVSDTSSDEESSGNSQNAKFRHIRDIIYLGCAYASNIGGTGSLTGTNPNLVLMGFLVLSYHGDTGLNYTTWMAYNVPGMLLCTLIGYLWLRTVLLFYIGCKTDERKEAAAVRTVLQQKLDDLGDVSFHEKSVTLVFVSTILLWILLKPEFIKGWGALITEAFNVNVSAATPALLSVFLLFVLPSKPFWTASEKAKTEPSPGCLTWDVLHHKLPWGVILLTGGGFALAEGSRKSGMSSWLGVQFKNFSNFPKEATLTVVCVLTGMLTEIMSNTAASSILLPVLNDMALGINVNPLYFLLPVTLCSSYAFMLPVATPPNAIVFDAAKTMPISRMMSAGVVMNVICISVALLLINTFGVAMFDLHTFPVWANVTESPV